MALIKSVRGFTPQIGKNCFLADNATLVGDVTMGDDCSVWFNTVLRGDVNSIRIGNGVNIQDGSVLHTLYEKSTIEIGDHVSIGHNVTIHGATRRSHHCRRCLGVEPHRHRTGKHLGRRTRQIYKESRPGSSQRVKPKDSTQLPDVRRMV